MHHGIGLIDIGQRYLIGTSDKTAEQRWQGSLFRFDGLWHERKAVVLLMLSLIGLLLFPKTPNLRVLSCAGMINFIFAVSCNVIDRFTLFLPGVVLLGVLGMIQFQALLPQKAEGIVTASPFARPPSFVILGVFAEYLARTSDCDMIGERFALETLPAGYELRVK